ncbi:MAG: hypothetical protein JO147_08880 [Actinobacteria bacterium]|nr:hypothetical protein [Actinomycetota bacterium]
MIFAVRTNDAGTGKATGLMPVQAESRRRVARFLYISDRPARSSWRVDDVSEGRRSERVAWRLVAGNNRPIARSAISYDSVLAAVEAARDLQERIEKFDRGVQFDSTTGVWRWQASDEGQPVADCVYSYARRFECERALRQFAEAVVTAETDVGDVRPLGPNAMRAYDRSASALRR